MRKAARSGDAAALNDLLATGKDPNAKHESGISGWTPLHSAAGEGEAACVALLLKVPSPRANPGRPSPHASRRPRLTRRAGGRAERT